MPVLLLMVALRLMWPTALSVSERVPVDVPVAMALLTVMLPACVPAPVVLMVTLLPALRLAVMLLTATVAVLALGVKVWLA